MQRIPLGRTGLTIPDFCLGTMTFGTHTPDKDAYRQMDMALEAGIDFLDTAEMYPVMPVLAKTVGRTEEVIGDWIAQDPSRNSKMMIATKICGQNDRFVRFGMPIDGETFRAAFEGALRRLRVDHIHLYQLHWPNRGSYHFRQNWRYDPSQQPRDEMARHVDEVLEVAQEFIDAGQLGAFGLSNESAWGTMQWLAGAERTGGPRVASIQNEYSLLCRLYDTDLGETAVHEDIVLLAFSPLATGLLTGKYQGGKIPANSRMDNDGALSGRHTERAISAVDGYIEVARRHGLDPVHMALAFTVQRPFLVSTIFGATTSEQLRHVIEGLDAKLSDEVLGELDELNRAHPMPY